MTARDDDAAAPATLVRRCLRISIVAEELDVSVSTVRRLIADGKLVSIRIGSTVRVTEASLDALLRGGARPSRRRGGK